MGFLAITLLASLLIHSTVGISENLSENFINRDLIVITAESLERTFYKNKNLKNLDLLLLKRKDIVDFFIFFLIPIYNINH